MVEVDIQTGGHKWVKQNTVTIIKGKKSYDLPKCEVCGAVGKRIRLDTVTLTEKEFERHAICKGFVARKKMAITLCHAQGEEFESMTPGSEHNIIDPPQGGTRVRGEWTMGKTEPVLILFDEFRYTDEKPL